MKYLVIILILFWSCEKPKHDASQIEFEKKVPPPPQTVVDTVVCGRTYTVTPAFTISNQTNKVYKGLWIRGAAGNAITIWNSSNIYIEDCIITDCGDNGVNILDNSSFVYIRYNYIRGARGRGIYFQGLSAGNINNCHGDSNYIVNVNSRNLVAAIQYNVATNGNTMNGNYIFHQDQFSDGGDILSFINTKASSANHSVAKWNYIEGYNGEPASAAIEVDEGCSYIDVEENVAKNPGGKGVAVDAASNVMVRNNKMYSLCVSGITNQPFVTGVLTINGVQVCAQNVSFINNRSTWRCGRSGVCMDKKQKCSDNVVVTGYFDPDCPAPTLSGNNFNDPNLVNDLQVPAQAKWARDHWLVCP